MVELTNTNDQATGEQASASKNISEAPSSTLAQLTEVEIEHIAYKAQARKDSGMGSFKFEPNGTESAAYLRQVWLEHKAEGLEVDIKGFQATQADQNELQEKLKYKALAEKSLESPGFSYAYPDSRVHEVIRNEARARSQAGVTAMGFASNAPEEQRRQIWLNNMAEGTLVYGSGYQPSPKDYEDLEKKIALKSELRRERPSVNDHYFERLSRLPNEPLQPPSMQPQLPFQFKPVQQQDGQPGFSRLSQWASRVQSSHNSVGSYAGLVEGYRQYARNLRAIEKHIGNEAQRAKDGGITDAYISPEGAVRIRNSIERELAARGINVHQFPVREGRWEEHQARLKNDRNKPEHRRKYSEREEGVAEVRPPVSGRQASTIPRESPVPSSPSSLSDGQSASPTRAQSFSEEGGGSQVGIDGTGYYSLNGKASVSVQGAVSRNNAELESLKAEFSGRPKEEFDAALQQHRQSTMVEVADASLQVRKTVSMDEGMLRKEGMKDHQGGTIYGKFVNHFSDGSGYAELHGAQQRAPKRVFLSEDMAKDFQPGQSLNSNNTKGLSRSRSQGNKQGRGGRKLIG